MEPQPTAKKRVGRIGASLISLIVTGIVVVLYVLVLTRGHLPMVGH
jgi:hypothetical protein